MKKNIFKIVLSLVLVLVTIFSSLPSKASAASIDYTSADVDKRIRIVQYYYATKKCLKAIDSSFGDKYNSNFFPKISDISVISDIKIYPGFNIATDDGDAYCSNILHGYRKTDNHGNTADTIYGGGAFEFLGLNGLEKAGNKEELWGEVFGYRKEGENLGSNQKYIISTKALLTKAENDANVPETGLIPELPIYGPQTSEDVSHVLEISPDGHIANHMDDHFAIYLKNRNKLDVGKKIQKGDYKEVSDLYKDFFATPKPKNSTTVQDFSRRYVVKRAECSAYGYSIGCRDYEGSNYETSEPSGPSIITSSNGEPVIKESSELGSAVYEFVKNGSIADSFEKYFKNKVFGGNIPFFLGGGAHDRVAAYKFWYDHLFGSNIQNDNDKKHYCSATAKAAADIKSGETQYDPAVSSDTAYGPMSMVNSSGELSEYHVSWGKFDSKTNKYIPIAGNDKIVGLYSSLDQTNKTCSEIAAELGKVAINLTPEERKQLKDLGLIDGQLNSASDGSTDSTDTESEKPTCFTAAGRSLGWLLCPGLDFVGNTTSKLYDSITEHFLNLKPAMFERISDIGSWQIFQNFANIGFIIIFLFVILSQVTGYGIDNYGIKRLLPRLIVGAILINLSFVICQLATDVSNIIGFSVNRTFTNLAQEVPVPETKDITSTEVNQQYTKEYKDLINGMKTAGGTVATISGFLVAGIAFVAAEGAAGAIVAALVGLITVLAAVFMVFIVLGMRQAMVAILTVVSPVIFVLYLFPGTQKIFSRLSKLFFALLMVFPICGLMIGGGTFASKLLLSINTDGGFLSTIIAMLVGVVPFFLIPSTLRSSMAAAGNIGSRVTNVGQGLGRAAQRGIQNNEGYRDWRNLQRAGLRRDQNGDLQVTAGGSLRRRFAATGAGRFLGAQGSMLRGQAAAVKANKERTAAAELSSPDSIAAINASHAAAAEQDAISARMSSIAMATNSGARVGEGDGSDGEDTLFGQYLKAVNSGDEIGAKAAIEYAGKDKATAKIFNEALKKDFEANPNRYKSESGQKIMRAVSQQVFSGKGGQMLSSMNPQLAEYTTQVNNGKIDPKNTDFHSWSQSGEGLKATVGNRITKASELSAMKTSAIEDFTQTLNAAAATGDVNALDAQEKYHKVIERALEEKLNSASSDTDIAKLEAIARAGGYRDLDDYKNHKLQSELKIEQDKGAAQVSGSFSGIKTGVLQHRLNDPTISGIEKDRIRAEINRRNSNP